MLSTELKKGKGANSHMLFRMIKKIKATDLDVSMSFISTSGRYSRNR